MGLRVALSRYWKIIQVNLFPWLEEEVGPLTEKQQLLITVLEMIKLEEHIASFTGRWVGRPLKSRVAIARAFVAKAVYNMPTTAMLVERLKTDKSLRRICGWERRNEVPSESTFSRAFAEFAQTGLPQIVHKSLIKATHKGRLVGHISRDATEIEVREKPARKEIKDRPKAKRKRGRPRKGEEMPKEPTRLEHQLNMNLDEMLDDLPKYCDVGTKKNSKGFKESWIGYKLHLDVADGDIPISCILTSASLHDSQAAIPLATMTAQHTTNFYDLMDSAYDVAQIKEHSHCLGHVPIIDVNPRRNKELKEEIKAEAKRRALLNFKTSEEIRYNERSAVERVNGRLKDEFGGRMIRFRGHAKVMCHLMFGILAITVSQLMHLVM
jgi:hypothetical protein